MGRVTADIKVADEVWIATALLHREQPTAADFSLKEIEQRLAREDIAGGVRPGVYPHISVHCVANRPPSTGRYRMLFETAKFRRRLFRHGDVAHPKRAGGKDRPDRDEIPAKYGPLLDWYEQDWNTVAQTDPLLELAARHRGTWKGVKADDYVRSLREGFE
jgi:hypothetical protein